MKYKKKHFYIENVSAERIAKKYGTPSYVYSHNKIKDNIKNFKKYFKTINRKIVRDNSTVHIPMATYHFLHFPIDFLIN